jgi:MOSC domain-containing protein YiiM
MPTLLSIQVGRPRSRPHPDGPWLSSIYKHAVGTPVRLDRLNLEGDEQADLSVHGGPDKAVCVYSADHFAYWRETLRRPELAAGAFGENFTVSGLDEGTVCLGDVFAVGTVLVEVSQPRGPCWKLGRKWERIDMPKLVLKAGKTGWYFRVRQPGHVAAGEELRLLERPYAQWTVNEVNRVAYAKNRGDALAEKRELASCPALSESWRRDVGSDPES